MSTIESEDQEKMDQTLVERERNRADRYLKAIVARDATIASLRQQLSQARVQTSQGSASFA